MTVGESLRVFDITGQAMVPAEEVHAGAVPELRWLNIGDMVIDDRYQRPLSVANWRAIRRIAEAFSWSRFTPVIVAPIVSGRYAVIDGQHRTHAARLCGFETVPAQIVVLAEAGQAAAFAAINGMRTAITPFHIYKAALVAGEDWALKSRAAVEAGGCRLMTSNASASSKKPREVYSIQTIRHHVSAGRGDMLTSALAALSAQPEIAAEAFTAGVLEPWFGALSGGGRRFLDADLGAFCAKHDLIRLRDGMVSVSKRPEYRGRTIRDLTQAAITTLLSRHVGAGAALPVPVAAPEDVLAKRMAVAAVRERKAMRAIT